METLRIADSITKNYIVARINEYAKEEQNIFSILDEEQKARGYRQLKKNIDNDQQLLNLSENKDIVADNDWLRAYAHHFVAHLERQPYGFDTDDNLLEFGNTRDHLIAYFENNKTF
ncbi:hypothetical protein [Liquorilactobacillus oeni]|uniref:Uncharacterized protein n=1 Tax=Liquorilactobacillus oeni DSM 19972 TaxID=1423777 RepID=A0A0R1MC46_9LACO|nr:hypothetical protein [Liquorilactobacillus oeni]KRL05457.1 hypothetical protein FD46_GL000873 [Liquorilactobacillus oeni DSM 19972]